LYRNLYRSDAGAVRQEPSTEHQEPHGVTDVDRLHDIEQKLHEWGYLSHHRDAERDVGWLLDQLAERDARVAELGARLRRNEWAFSLPWDARPLARAPTGTGSTYLYALAVVSITLVGFSALLVIFRQARGEMMTRYESYFLLSFIQPGFIVTGGSLLPSVLGLYGLPAPTVWRASSIIMAVPILLFVATLPGRPWFAVQDGRCLTPSGRHWTRGSAV
jgi:hypothetical protein